MGLIRTVLRRAIMDVVLMEKNCRHYQEMAVHELRNRDKYKIPGSLIPYGYKLYSQVDEDGMIAEIFSRIGVTNKTFIELGVGNGLENNTFALLFQGWKGLWVEGNKGHVASIKSGLKKTISSGRLTCINSFITRDNINGLVSSLGHRSIDLLSIDIDGNDYHVLKSITSVTARVLVIEYNARFVPPVEFCMRYDPNHIWKENDTMGASLKFLEIKLREMGYKLVGCNLSGANAFFVKEDLAGDRFVSDGSAENHYEPPRYYLSGLFNGHKANYATLEKNMVGDI